jgi:hypothetical protein
MNRASRIEHWMWTLSCALWALCSGTASAQVGAPNYQGLWWAAPAGSQSGWGINIAHQGDAIYATWFTYLDGSLPRWLAMTATKGADGAYSGPLVQFAGSPYSAAPYDSSIKRAVPFSGSASLSFDSATTGKLTYQAGSNAIVQPITMQAFGPLPTCVWGAQPDLSKATNFTDLWWASPPGVEDGWGVNLTHQGKTIFATWFTYGGGGNSTWFSVAADQIGPKTFSGILYRTTGPSWGTLPWDAGVVSYQEAGSATFAFADGNNALFTYNVNFLGGAGASLQTKSITRQVFRPPGTVCQ